MEQPQHGVHDLLLFRHLDFHCNAIHVVLSDPGLERIERFSCPRMGLASGNLKGWGM